MASCFMEKAKPVVPDAQKNLKRVLLLVDLLQEITKEIPNMTQINLAGDQIIDPFIIITLSPHLCRLTKILVPDAHQKMDEIIFAHDHNLILNTHQHGADMFDEKGNSVEHKGSVCTKANKYTAHFNWPVPAGKTLEDRRKNLLKSIKEKCSGGYAILQVKNGIGTLLHEYSLSFYFLYNYFERITIGKSNKHMMASEQCRSCKKFHRLEKYQECSNKLKKNPNATIDWDKIMETTKSQCKHK